MERIGEFRIRFASIEDAAQLASLNALLILDEGHRNPMTLEQLVLRMAGWLAGEYQAAIFESDEGTLGYALYRRDPEYVYLRQFFVQPERRRQGIGRRAMAWLWKNAWADASRVRIDVLVGNADAIAFWKSVGFGDYCLTMESERPPSDSA